VLFQLNGSRDTVKNNILFNANGGYLLRYTSVTNLVSNNNNYFYSNHFSPASASLAQHKALFAQDANSVENINPYFRGAKDLHASNILLKVAPTVTPSNSFYTIDFDGQSRTGAVSFGADEFTQPANDLVITEMQPAKIFAEGINDIKIRVYNNGSNAITSFNTAVQLTNYPGNINSGNYTPVNAGNLTYTFSGNIAPGASQLITLGQLNIPLYRNQIKINCTNTNGVADEVPYTDSVQNDNFYAGLNGTYTFNNSYPTQTPGVAINRFTDVSLQLKLGGVYGPSILNLKAGMHIGELRMDSIMNRGAISPLVIKSEDNDSTNTGITNGGSAYSSAITIFRASYVTVKKLNLNNTSYNAMLLGFSSQFINVENCRIKGSDALRATPGSTIIGYGIYASGAWAGMTNNNDSNYTFKNNYFDGGGSALSVNGNGLGNMRNVIIDSNTFINTKGDAINVQLVRNSLITNNIIETNTAVTNFQGIFCGSAGGTSFLKNNKIYVENDGSGIVMDQYYGYPYALTDSVKIFNNFISVGGTSGSTRGMNLYLNFKQVKIYNNSIFNRNTSASSIAMSVGENASQPVKFELINNIFHNKFSGVPVNITRTNSSINTLHFQHHNQLFTNGPVYGSIALYNPGTLSSTTTNYTTLAALAATGIDYSSVSGDPLFVSDKDLHVDGSNVNNVGDYTYTPQVPTDIDFEARSVSNPDIGADEFTLPDYGIVQLESPQSSCSHTATE
ncbi:MAG: right-handed parallel beta-helix repeat-containing protein, partial [Ferruginibacter sp.]|nr:right-handed parallel beta-helix repeat-containing protein [Ferruginibacter sp.]